VAAVQFQAVAQPWITVLTTRPRLSALTPEAKPVVQPTTVALTTSTQLQLVRWMPIADASAMQA
jgi:hypothetical protein